MALIDWSKVDTGIEVSHLKSSRNQLVIKLKRQELLELVNELEELYLSGAGELRLIVSHEWVLFWKERESGNRALQAHPEENQWVGTVALEKKDAQIFLLSSKNMLKNMQEGQSLTLGECVTLASVSNLDVTLILSSNQ